MMYQPKILSNFEIYFDGRFDIKINLNYDLLRFICIKVEVQA